MPIGGLLPYFDDEEERRRRAAEMALAPLPDPSPRPTPRPIPGVPGGAPPSGPMPGSPRPSTLPELFASGGTPLPAPGSPERLPMPPLASRQNRYEEVGEAKDVYLKGTPGRGRSAGFGALRGVGPGLQAGGLAGGLGGMVAGALGGLINPRGLREMEFNERVKPQIAERFAAEDAERALRTQEAKQAADAAMNRMQMTNLQSQIDSRAAADALNQSKFDFESDKPTILSPGQVVLGRDNTPVFTAPDRSRPADEVDQIEAALTGELGTVEEESQRSLEGRREMLKKHLMPDERRIVEGRITQDDAPEAIARAQAKWKQLQEDEFQSIRRDTGERRKSKVTQRRLGNKQGASQSSGYTRNVNNLPPLR